MKLPGENEERGKGLSLKYTVMGVSMSVLLVLGIVLLSDTDRDRTQKKKTQTEEQAVLALDHEDAQSEETSQESEGAVYDANGREKDIEKLYEEHRLTAHDLDFWDMYPPEDPELVKAEDGQEPDTEDQKEDSEEQPSASTAKNKFEEAEKRVEEQEKEKSENDGKHTLLTYADGSEEWVLINPYLEKNTYDFTRLTMKADQMAYYEDGKKSSFLGVDLSKYSDSVDFKALKEAGIDFAMIRLGARGYESGQIVLDEKFTDHMNRAVEAGLDTGVYFFSQAVSEEEAVQEAAFVVQNLAAYHITWPIAFDMEYVENDSSRIEALSREEKTAVAKAFLEEIKKAGYTPMLYGNKEWLIRQIDLTRLTGYDVWLSQQKDLPDYPYQFQMWQYTLEGSVNGAQGDVNLNVSFVDYTEK